MSPSIHNPSFLRVRAILGILTVAVCLMAARTIVAQGLPIPDYHETLEPFLQKHCVKCHGPDKQKGKFRVDTLGEKVTSEEKAEHWQEILDLLNTGEMPPPEEPRPRKEELLPVLSILYRTTAASRDVIGRKGSGKMRRMNRREFANTIEDLIGMRPNESLLPFDKSDNGFDTFGIDLTLTPTQLERYIDTSSILVEQMILTNVPKAKVEAPAVRAIFGDLSKYGGSAATSLSGSKKVRRVQEKRGFKPKKGVLPSPPDSVATGIFKRFVRVLYKGRVPSPNLEADMNALFTHGRKRGQTFWGAMVDPMAAAMASPNFIFLQTKDETLSPLEIANRLSYFLWSSGPDDQLLRLAKSGELTVEATYLAQIDRMLKDPKADRFYIAFTDQWLEVDRMDLVVIDEVLFAKIKKREEALKASMVAELRAFMRALIVGNLPARNLVDSEFTMLNETLSEHYGIPWQGKPSKRVSKIRGLSPGVMQAKTNFGDLKRVKLTGEDRIRGGLLGKGAVLMLTSNGSRTSPVERGAYILRKLLDRPPPPAPANVPEAPDLPEAGQSTRELLKHHTTTAQCSTCHSRIDPLGFGLESFDPMGQWREFEKQVPGSTSKVAVDSSGRMPDGTTFSNYRGLKQQLSKQDERVARSFVKALVSYAKGRPVGYPDRGAIDEIVTASKEQHYQLGSLIHQMCLSEIFTNQ